MSGTRERALPASLASRHSALRNPHSALEMPVVALPSSQSDTRTGTERPGARLVSLDVARGIAVVGMIVVNNPGSWEAVFGVLRPEPERKEA